MSRLCALCLGCLLCVALSGASTAEVQVVKVISGQIRGAMADRVMSFKGIPYAAPPVGKLRWRAPQPAMAWAGIRDATAFGNDCAQTPDAGDPAASVTPFSEDCLYLNVWRPEDQSASPLPVLVWIHGGGYVTGGTSPPIYDGSALARQGMVVVSLNYRLGRLGFFMHPALSAEIDGRSGNFAYLDMIQALTWVRDNISAFGGNPNRVTIMGESAGGDAVAHLITSRRAEGLFRQAAILSGNGRDHLLGGLSARKAIAVGQAFAEANGIVGAGPDALVALRALPVQALINKLSLNGLITEREFFSKTYAMGPIVDGVVVRGSPGEVLVASGCATVPVLIGTTTNDVAAEKPPPDDPLSFFGPDRKIAANVYRPYGTNAPDALLSLIGADLTMHEPARFVAREVTKCGKPAWLYRFDYVAESLRGQLVAGAPHASELPYLFGTIDRSLNGKVTDSDRAMSALFRGAVARFVKSGDPNGGSLPNWPAFDLAASGLMTFGGASPAVFGPDPWKARLDLVATVQDTKLHGTPGDLKGTSWQWVGFTSAAEQLNLDQPNLYTLDFSTSDGVVVRADCNRGAAPVGSPSPGVLRIGAMAMTKAVCPSGSLSDRYVHYISQVITYKIRDGELRLNLASGSGSLHFKESP